MNGRLALIDWPKLRLQLAVAEAGEPIEQAA
jgi:hypothetical protein